MVGNDTASGNTAKAFLMSDKITPKGETARKRERERKKTHTSLQTFMTVELKNY